MKAKGATTSAAAAGGLTASSTTSSSIPPSTATSTSSYPLPDVSGEPTDCPASTEILGRHTWTFLHSAAAYYPVLPSLIQKTSMSYLLKSLPILYPCSTCADELGDYMEENPIDEKVVSGRTEVERWLCMAHNEVNGRLGKEEFDCNRVQERWKNGPADGRCD